jgi:hypothetical protein
MPGNPIFLITFALAILLSYLAVRRRWAKLMPITLVGSLAACASFVLFAFSAGDSYAQAFVVGIVAGLLFIGMTISMAVYFRANEVPKGSKLPMPTDKQ